MTGISKQGKVKQCSYTVYRTINMKPIGGKHIFIFVLNLK